MPAVILQRLLLLGTQNRIHSTLGSHYLLVRRIGISAIRNFARMNQVIKTWPTLNIPEQINQYHVT